MKLWTMYLRGERKIAEQLKRGAPSVLAFAFAIVYIWFGALKVFEMGPIDDAVRDATDWIFPPYFPKVLGIWEVCIGIFIAIPPCRRLGLWLLFLQFPGTFLPLITDPELCFTSLPFVLTLKGQYIFKNLISIGGALALITTLRQKAPSQHSEGR